MTPLRAPRRGLSYVELCIATLILTLCLTPAVRTLPSVLASQRDLETRYQLGLIAQEKLAAAALALRASFVARDTQGDLAALGNPDWRYHVLVTVPAAGGGRYAVLCVQAWVDHSANLVLDAGETHVRFDTLVANRSWTP